MKLQQSLLPIAILLVSIQFTFAQTKTIQKSYNNIQKIELDVISGNIEIGASSNGQVLLDGEYDSDQVQVSITNNNGKLKIKEKSKSRRMNEASSWTLKVPNDIMIRTNTASGNVEVEDVDIELFSNTGSGNYRFENFEGFMKLNTGSGNSSLEMNGFKFNGELVMQCGEKSGNISAPFSFDKEEVIERGGRNNNMIRKTKSFGTAGTKIQVSTGSGTAKISK